VREREIETKRVKEREEVTRERGYGQKKRCQGKATSTTACVRGMCERLV